MRIEANPDHVKAVAFFRRVLSYAASEHDIRLIVIAHLVDSARPFIPTVNSFFKLQALLAKPSSAQSTVREYLSGSIPDVEHILNKEEFRSDPASIVRDTFPNLEGQEQPVGVVISDIGGYFAPRGDLSHLKEIATILENRGYHLIGVVEDTQNGHYRYSDGLASLADSERNSKVRNEPDNGGANEELEGPGFQIYSVAESPLKQPENHLVGVAVTFSVEAILRQSNIVLQSRRAGVIGFGPIGASVAHAMRNRGIPVSICELDPIRLAQAAAQGFRVYDYRHHFDDFVRDLNLIISATGAASKNGRRPPLTREKARLLQRGTYVASVTSADDEIDLEGIRSRYQASTLPYNQDVSKWTESSTRDSHDSSACQGSSVDGESAPHAFYLMLGGNAVNFRHNGVIGPAIQLLQGEIAMCIRRMIDNHLAQQATRYEVMSLSKEDRSLVAEMWLDQYITDAGLSD